MTSTEWTRYRKCPACTAELGEPCKSLTGVVVNGVVKEIILETPDKPHGGRKLRTGAVS